jgi:hypothetical protein
LITLFYHRKKSRSKENGQVFVGFPFGVKKGDFCVDEREKVWKTAGRRIKTVENPHEMI